MSNGRYGVGDIKARPLRVALYIDSGSIEPRLIPYIYEETRSTAVPVIARAYDVQPDDAEYAKQLESCRIRKAGGCNTRGEWLMQMGVDIMSDALNTDAGPDVIYIATADEAFAPLVDRLRYVGADVRVIGTDNAPESLRKSGAMFVYAEVLAGENVSESVMSADAAAEEIRDIISYYNGVGEDADEHAVYSELLRRCPDFDVRNYGCRYFDTFVRDRVSGVTVSRADGESRNVLRLIDDRGRLECFVYDYMAKRDYRIDDMKELLSAIAEEFPGFAMSNYGYHTDYGFILSFSKLEIDGYKGVKMKRTFKLSANVE